VYSWGRQERRGAARQAQSEEARSGCGAVRATLACPPPCRAAHAHMHAYARPAWARVRAARCARLEVDDVVAVHVRGVPHLRERVGRQGERLCRAGRTKRLQRDAAVARRRARGAGRLVVRGAAAVHQVAHLRRGGGARAGAWGGVFFQGAVGVRITAGARAQGARRVFGAAGASARLRGGSDGRGVPRAGAAGSGPGSSPCPAAPRRGAAAEQRSARKSGGRLRPRACACKSGEPCHVAAGRRTRTASDSCASKLLEVGLELAQPMAAAPRRQPALRAHGHTLFFLRCADSLTRLRCPCGAARHGAARRRARARVHGAARSAPTRVRRSSGGGREAAQVVNVAGWAGGPQATPSRDPCGR
jgi:hypothetical protein